MQGRLRGWSWWVVGLAAIACSEQLSNDDTDGGGGEGTTQVAGKSSVLPAVGGEGGFGADRGGPEPPEPPECSGGSSPRIYNNCTDYQEVVCGGQRLTLGAAGAGCDVSESGAGGDCGDYQNPGRVLGDCLDRCCEVVEATYENKIGTCTINGQCCTLVEVTGCGI